MKKRYIALSLAALTLGVSAGIMNREQQVTPAPIAPVTTLQPAAPYTPPASYTAPRPQNLAQKARFGLLSMIEPDMDAIWTTEDRADGKYLVDLQLRFKSRNGFGMPAANGLGQILHLQRRGKYDSYMIVGSNGNYFGAVDEKLEGIVTLDLYSGDAAPLWQRVRTFEFTPREGRR